MLFQPFTMGTDEINAAQNLEDVVNRPEIGVAVLGLRKDVPERADFLPEHTADVLVDRRAAEVR